MITVIITKELVTATHQCTETRFAAPFFPGESCEDIYNKNPQSYNSPGYYWILTGPSRVFCGMNYTGSSCENIYNNNPEIRTKSGYYRINDTHWTYCNMTAIEIDRNFISTCAGVGGQWRRIVDIDISAGDNCPSGWTKTTYSGYNFCQKSLDSPGCSSTQFSTNGVSYQRVCVVKQEDTKKGTLITYCPHIQLITIMLMDSPSPMAAHVNTSGLTLLELMIINTQIVLVMVLEVQLHLL